MEKGDIMLVTNHLAQYYVEVDQCSLKKGFHGEIIQVDRVDSAVIHGIELGRTAWFGHGVKVEDPRPKQGLEYTIDTLHNLIQLCSKKEI